MSNYSKELPKKVKINDLFPSPSEKDKISLKRPETNSQGELVLNDVYDFLGRFIVYPGDHARVAHTLWIAHTHLMACWDSTPRLAVLSPTRECGKTRVLEVTEPLVPNPIMAVNVSSAYLIRKIAAKEGLPTILYDEIDTVFGPKARYNEDTRAVINAGHRKGAVAGRVAVQGNNFVPEELPAYCAVALAGIGSLPDTIMSRSVVIAMRRRAANEVVEPWRERTCRAEGQRIREQLEMWASSVRDGLKNTVPDMPPGVEDRAEDMWEPLISVADAAGGDWPERARVACVALVTDSQGKTESLGIKLLRDLKLAFGTHSKLFTSEVLKALQKIEDAPWKTLEVDGLSAYKLASILRPYGIKSKDVRIGENHRKGYHRDDLLDAWERYLPVLPEESVTSATSATKCKD